MDNLNKAVGAVSRLVGYSAVTTGNPAAAAGIAALTALSQWYITSSGGVSGGTEESKRPPV
jgi:hypothetical protein